MTDIYSVSWWTLIIRQWWQLRQYINQVFYAFHAVFTFTDCKPLGHFSIAKSPLLLKIFPTLDSKARRIVVSSFAWGINFAAGVALACLSILCCLAIWSSVARTHSSQKKKMLELIEATVRMIKASKIFRS